MSSTRSSWSDRSSRSSSSDDLPPYVVPTQDQPLIEYCTNEWLKNPDYDSPAYERPVHEEFYDWLDDWLDDCLLVIKAPRFRRLILGLCVLVVGAIFLWLRVIGPWVAEESLLWRSLNKELSQSAGGLFGSNVRPHFAGMHHIKDMDAVHLPDESSPNKRLIFVGDIHGCKNELLSLMDKVKFKPETDHLIAVGDVVNKGPDSVGVIDYLMANNASCVRGNHEDKLLLMANDVMSSSLRSHNGKGYHVGKPKDTDPLAKLIRQLSHEQLGWLQSLPVILKVGNVKGIGDMLVVHGGLVPGVPLQDQDPFSVMNMRTIDLVTHVPSKFHEQEGSVPWFRLWSRYQTSIQAHRQWKIATGRHNTDMEAPALVVYGHDAKLGLQTGKYYRGLDSACVAGGSLTALVLSANGKQEIEQVDCPGYTKHKKEA
ncbi:hypothetical protein DV738_g3152, partial [Chaetothyriales sp. CBS 135597]